jgi:hypothetical protein
MSGGIPAISRTSNLEGRAEKGEVISHTHLSPSLIHDRRARRKGLKDRGAYLP